MALAERGVAQNSGRRCSGDRDLRRCRGRTSVGQRCCNSIGAGCADRDRRGMCPVAPRIGACSANRQDGSFPFADVGVACDDSRLHHCDRLGGGTATAVGVHDRNRIATRIVHIDGLCGLAGRPQIAGSRGGGEGGAGLVTNNRVASDGDNGWLILHHIDGGAARAAILSAGRYGIVARCVDVDGG